MKKIVSDGSCKDGKGTWAFVVTEEYEENGETKERIIYKFASPVTIRTTHNRMEYHALWQALEYAKEHFPDEEVFFYTDSKLVVNQLTLQSKVGKELGKFWKKCMPILDDHKNFILCFAENRKIVKYADSLASTVWNMEFG
jgi:ribonuclease HI